MENGVCLMSRNQRGELSNFSVFGPAQLQAELFFRSSSRDILASSHSRQAIRLSGCLISIGMRFSDSWRCSRCPLPPFGYCAIAIPPSSTLSLLTLDRPSQRFTDISKFLFVQGDYIRYPALLELSNKYGLQTDVSDASLAQQLEDLREQIRREIRKELKIKGQSPCRSLITRTSNEWL